MDVRVYVFLGPPSGDKLNYVLSGGWRNGNNHGKRLWLALLLFSMAMAPVPATQAQSEEHSGRKVIRTQKPDYPAILKSKGIGGVVRLNAKVLANGTVADVSILGGNPILAESAVKAVMTWRYAPAPSATYEIVALDFNVR